MNAPENVLIVDSIAPILAAIRERGVAIDPVYATEIRQIFGNAGLRVCYVRKRDGLSVDELGEMLWDRGFTLRRLDCREVLDLLEMLMTPKAKTRGRKRLNVQAADDAERKARGMRCRKFECPSCHQIARGTRNSVLICGVCYEMTGEVVTLQRVDPLPEEIASQAAGEMERAA